MTDHGHQAGPGILQRVLRAVKNPSPVALVGFGIAVALAVGVTRFPAGGGPAPVPLDTHGEVFSGAEWTGRLASGLDAYRAGNWTAAATGLRQPVDGPADELRRVLAASALALGGRPADAAAVLEASDLDALPEPLRSEARWTLAACLARTDRTEESAGLLERIVAEGSGPAAERARRMGAASRVKVVEELNWDAVAKRHDALYRRAVERRAVERA